MVSSYSQLSDLSFRVKYNNIRRQLGALWFVKNTVFVTFDRKIWLFQSV